MDEAQALRDEQGWQNSGHSAKTLAKHRDLRVVLIAMKQGTRMKEHRAGGSITIHVLVGQLRVRAARRTIDVPAGHLFVLDRALPHDVEALADTSCLLTVCAALRAGEPSSD